MTPSVVARLWAEYAEDIFSPLSVVLVKRLDVGIHWDYFDDCLYYFLSLFFFISTNKTIHPCFPKNDSHEFELLWFVCH